MSITMVNNQLCRENDELKTRIALLEKSLLKKEKVVMALEDSEKRYRRLFESAKDGILILDADSGMVVDVNPFLTKLLDYSFDEFRGKHIWEIGAFKDIAASKEAFKTLQDNEYIRYEDLPLKKRGGQLVEVEFVSNVYLVDHSKVIQCNIRDITKHKESVAKNQRLMMAIEQSVEAVVMTDAHGNIQFINPAFERTTGFSRHEIIGRNPRILKSDKQDTTFYRNLWDTIASGRTWEGRMVNKRKDGTLFTEESSISPVCDPAGRIVSYVSVKRNISEQIRLAAQFRQAQKMEAVGLLAGGVAHDYNNMLSVIVGFTELALDKIDLKPTTLFRPNGNFNGCKAFSGYHSTFAGLCPKADDQPGGARFEREHGEHVKNDPTSYRRGYSSILVARSEPLDGQNGSFADRSDSGQSLCQCQGRHCQCRQAHDRNGKRSH